MQGEAAHHRRKPTNLITLTGPGSIEVGTTATSTAIDGNRDVTRNTTQNVGDNRSRDRGQSEANIQSSELE